MHHYSRHPSVFVFKIYSRISTLLYVLLKDYSVFLSTHFTLVIDGIITPPYYISPFTHYIFLIVSSTSIGSSLNERSGKKLSGKCIAIVLLDHSLPSLVGLEWCKINPLPQNPSTCWSLATHPLILYSCSFILLIKIVLFLPLEIPFAQAHLIL